MIAIVQWHLLAVLILAILTGSTRADEDQQSCAFPQDCEPEEFCAYNSLCVPTYCNAQGGCDLQNYTCDPSALTCLPPRCSGGRCPPSFVCGGASTCVPGVNLCFTTCMNANFWCLDAACVPINCQNQSDCTRFKLASQCVNDICQSFNCAQQPFNQCPNASFICNRVSGLCERNDTQQPTIQPPSVPTTSPTFQPTSGNVTTAPTAPTLQPPPTTTGQEPVASWIFLGVYIPVILLGFLIYLLYRSFFAPPSSASSNGRLKKLVL